jgi:hypothetical protein
MFLNEDFLTKWVENNKGLCITRSVNNLNTFNFEKKFNYCVILTGYDNIINYFFSNLIDKIKSKIVLILIESDIINISNKNLDNDKIIHCFSWNTTIKHSKLTTLPIGLNFKRQYKSILSFLREDVKNENEKLLCFNCNLNTDKERLFLKKIIDEKMSNYCDKLSYIPFLKTEIIPSYIEGKLKVDITDPKCYNEWKKYKFILSPQGAGLDCHRTWEAIIMGVIPIIKSSSIDNIYLDLPVLIVKDWDELSVDYLNIKYQEIKENLINNKYNLDKLNLKYWTDLIETKLYVKPENLNTNDIYLITYGDEKYQKAKDRLYKQALEMKMFKEVYKFGVDDLTEEFKNKYTDILKLPRGGGYWIWKMDILEQMFDKMKENDFLIYLDAGCNLNKYGKQRLYDYISMFKENDGILSFQMHNQYEYFWTTKEIFEYFNTTDDMKNSGQYVGGVFILRKNKHSLEYLKLFKQCLEYDKWLITDKYNNNQNSNFKDARHDQSISSIIRKKIGSIVIPNDESWVVPFGDDNSCYYPFWATRSKV